MSVTKCFIAELVDDFPAPWNIVIPRCKRLSSSKHKKKSSPTPYHVTVSYFPLEMNQTKKKNNKKQCQHLSKCYNSVKGETERVTLTASMKVILNSFYARLFAEDISLS